MKKYLISAAVLLAITPILYAKSNCTEKADPMKVVQQAQHEKHLQTWQTAGQVALRSIHRPMVMQKRDIYVARKK
jgi:hypothetical protein